MESCSIHTCAPNMRCADFLMIFRFLSLTSQGSPSVLLAGSCALFLYMNRELQLSKRQIGWFPANIKFFCCDHNPAECSALIERFRTQIEKETGHRPSVHDHVCHKCDPLLMVVDMFLPQFCIWISFICLDEKTTMADLIATFEVNVMKVVFNPNSGIFNIDPTVKEAIIKREATATNLNFTGPVLSAKESNKVYETFRKMAKFEARGFRFKKNLSIHSEEDRY